MSTPSYLQRTPQASTPFKPLERSTEMVLNEATQRGYTYLQIPDTGLFEISNGQKTVIYKPQILPYTTYSGYYLAANKIATKHVLERAGISVTKAFFVHRNAHPESLLQEIFDALNKPLVVKPNDQTQGTNVFMNIFSFESLLSAVEKSLAGEVGEDSGVVIEEQFDGKEYRILCTPSKILGIIHRIPANVTGDGRSTIQQLIDQKNTDPRRLDDPNAALVKIKADQHVMTYLQEHQLTLDTVPAENQVVHLRSNSNISTGGDSIDMTDVAHPSVTEIVRQAMAAMPGLAIAGMDFMTKDITAPQTPESYIIIEINSSPGFSIHQEPYQGTPRNVASEYLDLLFK